MVCLPVGEAEDMYTTVIIRYRKTERLLLQDNDPKRTLNLKYDMSKSRLEYDWNFLRTSWTNMYVK
jgi:hypothetical protein